MIDPLRTLTVGSRAMIVIAVTALPDVAQVAPCFGVHIADWNADGRPDIFCAQNFFTPQPETGRMDGGMSVPELEVEMEKIFLH